MALSQDSWSRRWKTCMRGLGLLPDHSTKRAHRVKNLEVVVGAVRVSIHERDMPGCTVEVHVQPLQDEQWRNVVHAIAAQSILSAQVTSGALAPEVEQFCNEAGASLLPTTSDEFSVVCSCCSPHPCRHVATVYALIGEMLMDDPWILVLLRGREKQQLLEELRERRESQHSASGEPLLLRERDTLSYTAGQRQEGDDGIDEGDLAASGVYLERYWGDRSLLKQFQHHIGPPAVELTLLRRLGPFASTDAGMEIYEQLVSLYRSITEEALALAYASNEEA